MSTQKTQTDLGITNFEFNKGDEEKKNTNTYKAELQTVFSSMSGNAMCPEGGPQRLWIFCIGSDHTGLQGLRAMDDSAHDANSGAQWVYLLPC